MVDLSIEDWIYIYSQNKKEPVLRGDIYNLAVVVNKESGTVRADIGVIEEDIVAIETDIESIPVIDQQMAEVQDVIAKMIFELNNIGIQFEYGQINEFRDKYLTT